MARFRCGCRSARRIFGVTVKLPDLITKSHLPLDDSIRVWLIKTTTYCRFHTSRKKIRTQLENVTLHDGWQQIPGFLILRTTLHGPGWSLVTLYPYGNLHNRILKLFFNKSLYINSIGVDDVGFCWLLHRSLAKPLWCFVDVINKTATAPLSTRLPAQRLDELDSIAGAFNQLLDTLQVQYDNLENKVAERTCALNEAKRAEQA